MTGDDATAPRGGPKLSPDKVRHTDFSRTTLGRRGYNTEEVDRFLNRLAEELAARDAREARLRVEAEKVKNALKDWQSANARGHVPTVAPIRPTAEAVNLLSQAQQQADSYIAQAQEYCRQLIYQARGQADSVLRTAQTHAEAAAAQAAQALDQQASPEELEEIEARLSRTRAFLDAIGTVEAQLKTARETLAVEVDRLTTGNGRQELGSMPRYEQAYRID
ncbi:DivIVA domain-containing protein [Phytomonospora sp. NPDC050363]|uniref:DivIVA domain-containing protein n=1 Tax=Phytomonospora sp. NPDC050363 TaxID=3155642 RepID=UPI0033CA5BEC